MSILSDYNSAVDRILQDDSGFISSSEIDSFIGQSALQQYNKHRPLYLVADLTSNGGYDYEINTTNFPSWSTGFSSIVDIEYPAGEYQTPNIIPREEWMIYETSTKKYLRFLEISPATYTIRVKYSAPHSITSQTSTVYANDFDAFCNLAAAFCAGAIARRYAENSDSTIGADAVAYRDKSDIWASRSKDLLKLYMDYMFPKEIDASLARREWDTIYDVLSYSRLTHPDWAR